MGNKWETHDYNPKGVDQEEYREIGDKLTSLIFLNALTDNKDKRNEGETYVAWIYEPHYNPKEGQTKDSLLCLRIEEELGIFSLGAGGVSVNRNNFSKGFSKKEDMTIKLDKKEYIGRYNWLLEKVIKNFSEYNNYSFKIKRENYGKPILKEKKKKIKKKKTRTKKKNK